MKRTAAALALGGSTVAMRVVPVRRLRDRGKSNPIPVVSVEVREDRMREAISSLERSQLAPEPTRLGGAWEGTHLNERLTPRRLSAAARRTITYATASWFFYVVKRGIQWISTRRSHSP